MVGTMNHCPLCKSAMAVFYRIRDMNCVAQCTSQRCAMACLEGKGDSTEQAMDHFAGLALRVEERQRKAVIAQIGRCPSCVRVPCPKPMIKAQHPEKGCTAWTNGRAEC